MKTKISIFKKKFYINYLAEYLAYLLAGYPAKSVSDTTLDFNIQGNQLNMAVLFWYLINVTRPK